MIKTGNQSECLSFHIKKPEWPDAGGNNFICAAAQAPANDRSG
jgi:hypothetical protein